MNKKSVIYVVCPANIKTGGTELSHQLVSLINSLGGNSIITYVGKQANITITQGFEQYVNSFHTIDDVADEENNLIVIPEAWTFLAKKFKHIQISIWWMSVDNYLKNHSIVFAFNRYGINQAIKTFIKKISGIKRQLSYRQLRKIHYHFTQSQYAQQFLYEIGINSVELSDYINEIYYSICADMQKKENIILYNPAKGAKITEAIMKQYKGAAKWLPLQNMSNEQMRDTLLRSKVYIDFGPFPGKDRIPREAALSYCCLITGTLGASGNQKDLPIPDKYKFEKPLDSLDKIIDRINNCLDNYEVCITDFEVIRKKTLSEKAEFVDQVKSIFKDFI